ncbi:MAG: FAD-binding protein, partial [Patescibacteria group bacterium]
MINIQKNINLEKYNTLKIAALAKFFCVVRNKEEIKEALIWARIKKQKVFVLGSGSNVLLSKNFSGLVIKNELKGYKLLSEKNDKVLVEAQSGEIWTKFVNFTVDKGLYGLENLFLIYGTVGAAPVQNIGAYGVELKDCFYSLRA